MFTKIYFCSGIKYALTIALTSALLLSLCGCQKSSAENWSAKEVQQQAFEYLASRYSAEFTILNCYTKANSSGPIPGGGVHWELIVKSDQFPEDNFFVYYGREKNEDGEWHWTDNYYSLIFCDEANSKIKTLAEQFFGVDCLVESLWGINLWPENIGENSTFKDWLNAGGKCPTFVIYLEDTIPEETLCQEFTNSILSEIPTLKFIFFHGMTADAFYEISTNNEAMADLWNNHPEWRLGIVSCSPIVP